MGGANGILITQDPLTGGPDDPNVSYANNLYAFVQAALTQWFKAQDPARNSNRYVYCSNNPINLIDPLGLETYFFNGIRYTNDADPFGGYSDDVASIAAEEGIQDFHSIPVYDQGGDNWDAAIDLPREYAGGGRYTDSTYTRISSKIKGGALYDNVPAGKTREDLNLWGYSGGGAVAVNDALKLNRAGYHVDNVVLINAVCKDKFVDTLKAQGTNVVRFDAQDDLLRQYRGSLDTLVRELGRALSGKESMFGDKSLKAHSSWHSTSGIVSRIQIRRTIQQIQKDMAKSQRIEQLKGKKVFGDQRNSDYKWAAQRNEEYKWATERNRDQGWGR